MRNRTELLTNTLPSENEEEPSDLDDSEEDWKPSEKKGAAGKVTKASPKGGAKRKSAGGKGAKKSASKKSKKDESEEEDEEDEDEELDESEEEMDDEEDDSNDGKAAKKSTPAKSKSKSTLNSKGFPDKDGKFDLYIFKNDLSKDYKSDPKLCMWRRDGSSLLQKYLKAQDEDASEDLLFKASSVYSCWEEKRKHDFFEIKVQCVGDKKDGVVKVLDIEQLTKFANEDRPMIDTGINEEDGGEGEENEEDEDEPEDEE